MHVDVKTVVERIEDQLGAFESTFGEARTRISQTEKQLNNKINKVRKHIEQLAQTKDIELLSQIVDMLYDIERIVDKLDSVDITPIGSNETSLESLIGEEYERFIA